MDYKRAVAAIGAHHILLVYPIKNAAEPKSLWSVLHPRTQMRWDWSEDADPRVVNMWHLKDELCRKKDVVYAKWFQNRATFFSKRIFPALLRALNATEIDDVYSPFRAQDIYEELLSNSPQTPRQIREAVDLTGAANTAVFEKAVKRLWRQLLIVGTGEVDEGQFPALAMGATKHIFEELWRQAEAMEREQALQLIALCLNAKSPFLRFLDRARSRM
jgi:hypothetical protein